MKKITRNDYFELIRKTGKIPQKNEYEILSLDLSAYPLSDNTKKIADTYFAEESTDKNGNYLLKGHAERNFIYLFTNECAFQLHQVDGYSSYAFSDEQMAVFTYCEGDIYLTLFTDRVTYEKEKLNTEKFYLEEY